MTKKYWNTKATPGNELNSKERHWNKVMAKTFSLQRHCVVHAFKIIVYLYSTYNRKSQLGRE